jgi:hypothetical protein
LTRTSGEDKLKTMSTGEAPGNPRVFVGSTALDLAKDCRRNAIRGIRRGGAEAVCMENWDASHRPALEVCQELVQRNSSHYIGLFAYYRGYVQNELGISITQAEYEWARECPGPGAMAVFIPDAGSVFAITLRRRASKQTSEDFRAQTQFLKAVSSKGVYLPFEDPADLEGKVTVRVLGWSGRTLGNLGLEQPMDRKKPARDDLVTLGRQEALAVFEAIDTPLACFLISGPPGYGHEFVVERLASHAKASAGDLRIYHVAIGGLWREPTVGRLVRTIGAEIGVGETAETVDQLAAILSGLLEKTQVLIEIGGIGRLSGMLPEFVDQFWMPLYSRLASSAQRRLIVLATTELNSIPARWTTLVRRPTHTRTRGPFGERLPVLVELGNYTGDELNRWLRRWLSITDAEALSRRLIEETGGVPAVLYQKLIWDETTWARSGKADTVAG